VTVKGDDQTCSPALLLKACRLSFAWC